MMLNIDDFNRLVTKLVAKECDWNTYSGKFFLCACGGRHQIGESANLMHLIGSLQISTSGIADAKVQMVISCPSDRDILTIIRAKYKYLFVFDCFESIAGCNKNKPPNKDRNEYLDGLMWKMGNL